MGSMMFYEHAQRLVFSEHAQDVLLFYAHAYWMGGSEHAHDGCLVHIPFMFVNSKFQGAK